MEIHIHPRMINQLKLRFRFGSDFPNVALDRGDQTVDTNARVAKRFPMHDFAKPRRMALHV